MSCRRSTIRTVLFAGVSTLALTVGAAELRAADLAPVPRAVLKAPPPVQAGVLTIWLEGAAFWTGGEKQRAFGDVFSTSFATSFCTFGCTTNDFGAFRPGVGWEAAAGFDYRFAGSPWHVSADFRYGRAKSKSQAFHTAFSTYTSNCPGGDCVDTLVHAQAFARQTESHMVADFMIGRDIGLGGLLGMSQVKFGVRVADLEARLHIDAQVFASCANGCAGSCGLGNNSTAAAAVSLDERSRFIGVGPRAAIEGTVPLGGPWAVDYMGGLAVLFGDRKLDITASGVSSFSNAAGLFSFHTQISDSKGVFNADASLALAYWFTPRAKLSAGFRFDGYWQALKTFDLNGNITNVDRFYYGPFVRLTGAF
jgi:hypothetical protein